MFSCTSSTTFTALTLSLLLTPTLCAQKIPHCREEIWDISYQENAEEGDAEIVITAPDITEQVQSVGLILTCNDLEVNGTGRAVLDIDQGENVTVFQVSVPEAKDAEEFETQGGWLTHHCVIQFTYFSTTDSVEDASADETECELKILTIFGRILPRCNLVQAQPLVKHVEISKELGQVLLHFRNSGNEVFTHDSKCEVGSIDDHDHAVAMEENMIPLAPPGADSPVIDIDFYPDCENETVFELYKDREMSGCHLELYQVCQEGHQLVRYLELDFDEGVLKCEVPKSSLQVALEALELLFFIDSRPVVGLLFLLVLNGALYLLLIPIAVCKVGRCCTGRGEKEMAEEKRPLLENPQTPPESPPAHLHTSPQTHPQTAPPQSHPHTLTPSQ